MSNASAAAVVALGGTSDEVAEITVLRSMEDRSAERGRYIAAMSSPDHRVAACSPPRVGQRTRPQRNPMATACARSAAPTLRKSRRAWVLTVSSDR